MVLSLPTNGTLESFHSKMLSVGKPCGRAFLWVASQVSLQMRKGKLRERVWPYYSTPEQPGGSRSLPYKAQALWSGTKRLHSLSSDPCSDCPSRLQHKGRTSQANQLALFQDDCDFELTLLIKVMSVHGLKGQGLPKASVTEWQCSPGTLPRPPPIIHNV